MIKPPALHHVLHHHHAGHHAHATTFFFFTGLCEKGPNFVFSKERVCITLGLSAFPYFGFSLLRIQAFGRFGMPARHEMAHSIEPTAKWLKEWQSRHDICLELDVVPRFFSLVDDLGQPITHNQRNAVCIRSQFEGLHQIYTKLDLRCLEIPSNSGLAVLYEGINQSLVLLFPDHISINVDFQNILQFDEGLTVLLRGPREMTATSTITMTSTIMIPVLPVWVGTCSTEQ